MEPDKTGHFDLADPIGSLDWLLSGARLESSD